MAGIVDTALGIVCSSIGVFCPEVGEPPTVPPGDIAPGFYKKVDPPATRAKVPKPATLVAPSKITFGRHEIGNGQEQKRVEIANSGELSLPITALEVSGSESFNLNGECNVIKPGGVCLVDVVFAPVRAGDLKGSMLVGTPGAIHKIALTGAGFPRAVTKPKTIKKKPRVVRARPKPKLVPREDPRVEASIRSLEDIIAAGPKVFSSGSADGLEVTALPPLEDRFHLEDKRYKGKATDGSFKKNVSSFPVERCRIVPTGTMIPLVLDSPVNSQICGPVMAHVAVDVYGPDGRIRLLKMGSKVEGTCDPLDDPDASRIQVEFTKLTRPDGAVVKLEKAQGADAMGQSGMVGEKFDRIFDKYGPTAIASTIGAVVAYATAPNTNSDGVAVDSPLSAAGEAFNQNIAQIVAEELRNATNRKRRIRIKKGTLLHIKPTNYWYFPNPYQIVEVDPKNVKLTYACNEGAFKSDEGRRQNPER